MIPPAHAGHVLVDLLYAAPLFVLFGVLLVGKLRERRARDREATGDDPRPADDSLGRPADGV